MAKGYEKHKEREENLSLFGKDLVRRSGSCCELCNTGEVKLSIYEVPPAPAEPDFELCIFICDSCRSQLDKPKTIENNYWRNSLHEKIWSEIAPVQVTAYRLLQKISLSAEWAVEILDQAYLDEEIREWAAKAPL